MRGKVKLVERGEFPAADFMTGITAQTRELVRSYEKVCLVSTTAWF
jgi:hypothetical protein